MSYLYLDRNRSGRKINLKSLELKKFTFSSDLTLWSEVQIYGIYQSNFCLTPCQCFCYSKIVHSYDFPHNEFCLSFNFLIDSVMFFQQIVICLFNEQGIDVTQQKRQAFLLLTTLCRAAFMALFLRLQIIGLRVGGRTV